MCASVCCRVRYSEFPILREHPAFAVLVQGGDVCVLTQLVCEVVRGQDGGQRIWRGVAGPAVSVSSAETAEMRRRQETPLSRKLMMDIERLPSPL